MRMTAAKARNPQRAIWSTVLALVVMATTAQWANAAIVGPYTADGNTTNLWNFDQTSGDFTDAGSNPRDVTPDPGTQGGTALAGFGNAADFSADGASANNTETTWATSDMVGVNGEFTIEAMVNLTTISNGNEQQIITKYGGDGTFQFRIAGGDLSFVKVDGGIQNLATAIPTTGDDAFVANEWFHLAVAYNGSENTADNFKLYWTKVDASRTEANEIFSGNLTEDLPAGDSETHISARPGGDSEVVAGLMDEMRISNIARGPGDMRFTVIPEPASLAMGLMGLTLIAARRRR